MMGIRSHSQNNRQPNGRKGVGECCAGRGGAIIIDDFEGGVEDGRLELSEEQVQWVRKQGIEGRNRF